MGRERDDVRPRERTTKKFTFPRTDLTRLNRDGPRNLAAAGRSILRPGRRAVPLRSIGLAVCFPFSRSLPTLPPPSAATRKDCPPAARPLDPSIDIVPSLSTKETPGPLGLSRTRGAGLVVLLPPLPSRFCNPLSISPRSFSHRVASPVSRSLARRWAHFSVYFFLASVPLPPAASIDTTPLPRIRHLEEPLLGPFSPPLTLASRYLSILYSSPLRRPSSITYSRSVRPAFALLLQRNIRGPLFPTNRPSLSGPETLLVRFGSLSILYRPLSLLVSSSFLRLTSSSPNRPSLSSRRGRAAFFLFLISPFPSTPPHSDDAVPPFSPAKYSRTLFFPTLQHERPSRTRARGSLCPRPSYWPFVSLGPPGARPDAGFSLRASGHAGPAEAPVTPPWVLARSPGAPATAATRPRSQSPSAAPLHLPALPLAGRLAPRHSAVILPPPGPLSSRIPARPGPARPGAARRGASSRAEIFSLLPSRNEQCGGSGMQDGRR